MFEVGFLDDLQARMELARRLLRVRDADTILDQATSMDGFNVNLLYGYVRSFVRLAYIGNVDETARQIKSTRQSVGRHIVELENLLDTRLFEKVGSKSSLTKAGVLWLPRCEEFCELASAFLNRRSSSEAEYRSVQLPIRSLTQDNSSSPFLREFAKAWMTGEQTLECTKIGAYFDHCILYERSGSAWRSKSIGEKSAFSRWFGPKIANESAGKSLTEMETGADIRSDIAFLLDGIYARGGLHFSESSCNFNDPAGNARKPVLYQRVLAELSDSMGRPLVASLIEIIDPLQTDRALY